MKKNMNKRQNNRYLEQLQILDGMILNNILEPRRIAFLVSILILRFIDLKKEENKIIVFLIPIRELVLVVKMERDVEFGLIKIYRIHIVLKWMNLMKMDILFYLMLRNYKSI